MNDQIRMKSAGENDTPPANIPPQPGTYLLFIAVDRDTSVTVGRLGEHLLRPGLLVYVGSAHGSGGLRARVLRHLRQNKSPHWHIDALTARFPVTEVWYAASTTRLECTWANQLANFPGVRTPINKFGASDCSCATHLFVLDRVQQHALWKTLRQTVSNLTRYET